MKILMVEDDVLLAKSLSRVLSSRGHQVDVVSAFSEGKARLTSPELDIDVLLLDREVGEMDGWSLQHLAPSRVKVVLMTGRSPENAPAHYLKGLDLSPLFLMIES